jgi:hypothetical protein
MAEYLSFVTTEGVLSALLLMTAAVLLRWFTTTGWKDIQAERRERLAIERLRQESEIDLERRRVDAGLELDRQRVLAEIEVQRQTAQELLALNQNLADSFAEARAIATFQKVQHTVLVHILDRMGETSVASETA